MNKNDIQPIDIILVTFNRLNFLQHAVKKIYERTSYPYRIWVTDNNSTDGTQHWLKKAKLFGYIHDYILLDKNYGLAGGFTEGFKYIDKQKGGISDYIITTQDDIICPDLKPCWLERIIHLLNKYPEYDSISMRIQRTRHKDIDESREVIPASNSCPSCFRISKKEDIIKMGLFGYAKHWETVSFSNKMKKIGRPRLAMATNIYADHIGFSPDNKGFSEGFTEYHTYSKERVKQGEDQPYPDIDPVTNIPIQINSPRDKVEQERREDQYKYWGVDFRYPNTKNFTEEQKVLSKYAEKGKGLDIGCGKVKCHPNAIGVDMHHESKAEIKADCRDLFMFKDNELDFIVSSHTLEHMPDFISVLKEWKRVLKPGGVMAIAVPDGEIKPKYITKNGHKVNLGLGTFRYVFKHMLGMKIIRLGHVKKNNPSKFVALVVAIKK